MTALSLAKSVHIEGYIEPAGVDMRSQNPCLCGRFVGIRLPVLAIRVGEVPSSNLGAPIFRLRGEPSTLAICGGCSGYGGLGCLVMLMYWAAAPLCLPNSSR
jgi:hypothetical protein